MKIANPLYDHAFKYLMSNDLLARKVLSVILHKEVLELELAQQEIVVEDQERQFTIYRLDFKALIEEESGRREMVLIELQKSKLPTNMLRFRSYLGLSYAQQSRIPDDTFTIAEERPLPLISIYILGYNIQDIPVMAAKVDRKVIDLSTREELDLESDFIDMLTHECYILQVRRLPEERRSRIEQFMTLFNQAWIAEEKFILNLEEVPEEFEEIAEYLRRPLMEEKVRARLRAEEEIEQIFAHQEAEKEQFRQQVEEERRQKEEERRLKEKEHLEKIEAQQKAREFAIILAHLLLQSGKPIEEVAIETGLTEEDLRQLSGS